MIQAPQASGNFAPRGDVVPISVTHPSHFGFPKAVEKGGAAADLVSGFAGALKDAFYKVNDLQVQSDELTKALAVTPGHRRRPRRHHRRGKGADGAPLHQIDRRRVTQAYKELINMR